MGNPNHYFLVQPDVASSQDAIDHLAMDIGEVGIPKLGSGR